MDKFNFNHDKEASVMDKSGFNQDKEASVMDKFGFITQLDVGDLEIWALGVGDLEIWAPLDLFGFTARLLRLYAG